LNIIDMKKMALCLLMLSSIAQISKAQSTRYVIKFKDKATTPFSITNQSGYLSARAIARRTKYNIAIDSTDLPVTPRYVDSVRLAGAVTVLNVSKWLNSVTIQTTDAAALNKINSFSFVQASSPIAARIATVATNKFVDVPVQQPGASRREMDINDDVFNYGSSYAQVHIHNGEFLHNIGLRGQGMTIAMLDAGFQNYLTVRAFDSARANGLILGTWDFVARESSVNEDNAHGMECFSTIAANIPGQFVGTAPKAAFYLFRSEDASSEYPIEEHNWVCAAERADSSGSDMISSSLGYNTFDNAAFNHNYADMNGNTTMIAIGADLAAKKGMLVVNSAGNEGDNAWGKIVTPADGDSVMAVAAVNTSGAPANFTSRGPSSDGQVKPDLASVGVATVIQHPGNVITTSNGTSFAAPNLAGLTACLWQGFQEFNNMKILNALRGAGNRATNPNDTIGYGIPDVKKAVLILLKDLATSAAAVSNCNATLNWESKDIKGMKYEIERKVSGQTAFTKIAEVNALGNSFSKQNYQYEDDLTDAPSGTISYRIRQVIDTASQGFTADFIDTTSVSLSSSCLSGASGIALAPNPSRGALNIRVTTQNATQNLIIRISNSLGQIVAEIKKSKAEGVAFFDVPVFNLASGKYYVSVFDDKKLIETKQLVKL
jgi:hypothetical protein